MNKHQLYIKPLAWSEPLSEEDFIAASNHMGEGDPVDDFDTKEEVWDDAWGEDDSWDSGSTGGVWDSAW